MTYNDCNEADFVPFENQSKHKTFRDHKSSDSWRIRWSYEENGIKVVLLFPSKAIKRDKCNK